LLDQHNGGCLALEDSVLVPHNHSHSSIIDDTISDPRKLADFEWDIVRKAGYPIFSFANSTQSEVTFKYSVSGTETGTYGTLKYLRRASFWRIVTTANLPAILIHEELTEVDEFTVELDILQEFIDSDYYTEIDQSNATIDFCLRRLRVRSCRRIGRKRNQFSRD
jgi:hypothetical protein